MVGFEYSDDSGVYKLDSTLMGMPKIQNFEDMLMIQSVDFITPVVDDPYIYGQIAAANALSDIFAMGAEAKVALNLLMWDKTHIDHKILGEILRGGMSKLNEANCTLLGGHSIVDVEQKYGLCVTGFAKKIWRNNTPRIGDVLVLSKPIGSGVITTGLKNGKIAIREAKECINTMTMLNLEAMRIAKEFDIHAATDITGFGLIGHLLEMCSEVAFELWGDRVSQFSGVDNLLSLGVFAGGSKANFEYFKDRVSDEFNGDSKIFYDAQTSGGIVFALCKEDAGQLLDKLRHAGYEHASIIGAFIDPKEDNKKRIFLR